VAKPITHILFPTDFSQLAHEAEDTAARLARATGAKVSVVHVDETPMMHRYWQYSPKSDRGGNASKDIREKISQRLDEVLAGEIWNDIKTEKVILEGDPAFEIVEWAKGKKVDLIVIPTQGETPFLENLLGGTARKVAEQASCSVLLVRRQGMLKSYASAKSKSGKTA
jgi:nucleotide-binding universal stress UspA family protein